MDYLKKCGSFITALCIMLGVTTLSGAQPSMLGNISIEKGGKVWIEGSAGMINYQCDAEKLSGVGQINNTRNPQNTVKEEGGEVKISVSLPVKALSCGKRAMDKDMYEALKSEQYPTIKYQLLNAQLADTEDEKTGWMNIRTRGIMEIAGVQDTTSFLVQGKLLTENRFQVKGSKKIQMETYNVKPPRAMFGLIKADEELTVHFDVTVTLEEQSR